MEGRVPADVRGAGGRVDVREWPVRTAYRPGAAQLARLTARLGEQALTLAG
ncbi:hypothetical protein [Streptomyces sp. NPDC054784]